METQRQRPTHYRWFVMALIFLLFMVAQADRANIGFAIPFMQKEFELSNTETGVIISLFFAGYGLFQIPAGFIVKKTGIRTAYMLGMIFTSAFTFLMGRVDSALHLKMLRVLVGVSEAPVVISSFAGNVLGNLVGGWISDNIFARRRKPLMLVSAFCTIFMMAIMMNAPHDKVMLTLVLFMVGFLLSLGYSAYSVYAMGRVEKASYPVAYSVINMGGQIGAVIMPLVVDLLDSYDWSAVFMALSIAAVVCLLVVLTIREPVPQTT